jgi:hypothetical protein
MTPLSASGAATSHRRLRRVLISTTYAKSRPRSPTPLPSLNSKQRSSRMPGNADPDVETGSARAEEELREQRIHDGRSPVSSLLPRFKRLMSLIQLRYAQGLDKMAAEAAAGWQAAYAELKRQDERMFHEYKEDIDTVLIFVCTRVIGVRSILLNSTQAGLFSAVVSSLLSQSYPLLQQDNTQVSAETLVTISQQLAALLSNATSGQEAPSPLPPAAFVPVSYAIRVNVLWFLSLVFSLAAALFGIVIKGWMQEYMVHTLPLSCVPPTDVRPSRPGWNGRRSRTRWAFGSTALRTGTGGKSRKSSPACQSCFKCPYSCSSSVWPICSRRPVPRWHILSPPQFGS